MTVFDEGEDLLESLDHLQLDVSWLGGRDLGSRESPGLMTIFVAGLILLAPAVLLNRGHWPRSDFKYGLAVLKARPWLIAVPFAAWFAAANAAAWMSELLALMGLGTAPIDSAASPDAEFATALLEALSTAWVWIYLLVLAPIHEELFFRGWLHRKTQHWQPRWRPSLLNAWTFALAHALAATFGLSLGWQLLPIQSKANVAATAFGLGLLLCWVRNRYDSISLCIILHSTFNLGMLSALYFILMLLSA